MDLGLGYESSDDEVVVQVAPIAKSQEPVINDIPTTASARPGAQPAASKRNTSPQRAPTAPTLPAQPPADAPISGPALGPPASLPPGISGPPDGPEAPGSPYTSARALVRSLTLPTVPNFNIPDSPPGSPPPRSTAKFTQFLDLKKKGVHFNQRLETSSVLKDPAHLQRLFDFAGISEEAQYASTLPEGIAVPVKWEKGAYVEELRESQKRIARMKEEEAKRVPREKIDFVSAGGSGTSSKSGTPSGRGDRQSASDRVMAGLNRATPGNQREMEQRGRGG